MKKDDFNNLLLKEFPVLYREMFGPMDKTCMSHGVAIGSGWFDLLYDMSVKLNKLLEVYPDLCILQVKEKFANLRVYISQHSKEIGDIINEAVRLSTITCEECGSQENVDVRGRYWIKTICAPCQEKREAWKK